MIKILWFSNALLENTDRGITGTWLHAMSEGLTLSGKVILGIVTSGRVNNITRSEYQEIQQWIVPDAPISKKNGLPDQSIVQYYMDVIEEFQPDLIHVWGIESYPGLITARNAIEIPTLLEIQGIAGAVGKFVDGGLTFT